MAERYPGYDVLSKRHTMSWNEITRRVVDHRMAVPREPRFFSKVEWEALNAVCGRILPQPKNRPPIPLAALIDQKLMKEGDKGFRVAPLPIRARPGSAASRRWTPRPAPPMAPGSANWRRTRRTRC